MPDTTHDPETGEVFDQPDGPETILAADGGRTYGAANTLADFVRMLEDGQFDADVTTELRDLAANLQDVARLNGKSKGSLTIKVDFICENGFFRMQAQSKVAMPVEKRPASVAWATEDNRFTASKPNQGSLFGTVRDVTPKRNVRN